MIGMRSTRMRRRRNPAELILVNPGFPGQNVYRPRRRALGRMFRSASAGYSAAPIGYGFKTPKRTKRKAAKATKKRRKKNMAVVRRRRRTRNSGTAPKRRRRRVARVANPAPRRRRRRARLSNPRRRRARVSNPGRRRRRRNPSSRRRRRRNSGRAPKFKSYAAASTGESLGSGGVYGFAKPKRGRKRIKGMTAYSAGRKRKRKSSKKRRSSKRSRAAKRAWATRRAKKGGRKVSRKRARRSTRRRARSYRKRSWKRIPRISIRRSRAGRRLRGRGRGMRSLQRARRSILRAKAYGGGSQVRYLRAHGMLKVNPSGGLKVLGQDLWKLVPTIGVGLAGLVGGFFLGKVVREQILPKWTSAPQFVKTNAAPLATGIATLLLWAASKLVMRGKFSKLSVPILLGGAAATAVHAILANTGLAAKLGLAPGATTDAKAAATATAAAVDAGAPPAQAAAAVVNGLRGIRAGGIFGEYTAMGEYTSMGEYTALGTGNTLSQGDDSDPILSGMNAGGIFAGTDDNTDWAPGEGLSGTDDDTDWAEDDAGILAGGIF
jgi:hypothetical protein